MNSPQQKVLTSFRISITLRSVSVTLRHTNNKIRLQQFVLDLDYRTNVSCLLLLFRFNAFRVPFV